MHWPNPQPMTLGTLVTSATMTSMISRRNLLVLTTMVGRRFAHERSVPHRLRVKSGHTWRLRHYPRDEHADLAARKPAPLLVRDRQARRPSSDQVPLFSRRPVISGSCPSDGLATATTRLALLHAGVTSAAVPTVDTRRSAPASSLAAGLGDAIA